MARTHVTRTSAGKTGLADSYGEMLDPARVQDIMDKLDEHDTALDSGSVIYGIETLDGTTGKIIADLAKQKSYLAFTGTKAFTLPDGTFTGQTHEFECTSAGSTPIGTLTITTPAGTESATHIFAVAGQYAKFEWNGTGWHMVAKRRAGHRTLVIGTTLTAGMDMEYTYDLSVTGSVTSTTTMALPDGTVPGEKCHLDVTTAASSAAGTLGFTGMSTVGAAVTSAANIGNGGTDKSFVLVLEWSGAEWQIVFLGTNTGVTIS